MTDEILTPKQVAEITERYANRHTDRGTFLTYAEADVGNLLTENDALRERLQETEGDLDHLRHQLLCLANTITPEEYECLMGMRLKNIGRNVRQDQETEGKGKVVGGKND